MPELFILAKKFTLGKEERLKSRKQTEQLFSEGKKFSQGLLRVHFLESKNGTPGLLFGIGVGTRSFKKAVERNRIKRMVREAYRLQKMELQEKLKAKEIRLSLFIIFTGKSIPVYEEVYLHIGKVLDKLSHQFNLKT